MILVAIGQKDDTLGVQCLSRARVVSHQDNGAGVTAERVQDLLAGDRVEVVGGLVEQQYVCCGRHEAGQC